ncbi:hypothetical protein [Akkermansia muciniphila]|uniref:hypothetical protein n=1 Tax=Akkermansia muciniphila TaxID=239935 RepID=UPI001C529FCF|nr:hypothetical protein [Akkermansia muciniphila]
MKTVAFPFFQSSEAVSILLWKYPLGAPMNVGEHPNTRTGARTGTSLECSTILPPETESMYHSAATHITTAAARMPPAIFNANSIPFFPGNHEPSDFPDLKIPNNFILRVSISASK